ncbi:uncharacterized protein LAESUDRAFT_760673 [Laetiporus sulphureus 93-53]|uniref:F-box domain-containing protein n=1 Tax=Laetiporus sulphureus 93-53 TaxID=1314785 RepID=A0A165DI43_9APHY|nr:uncharacterized protein LAESUDRAFT_760673 [Laetiporus sulphureus 93-53]KZT04931.1 hypothetical protein LAESUDRAFT_760673 [Laetiporus sulphureus 93-53]
MASSEQQLKHITKASGDNVQRLALVVNGGVGPVTLARPQGARRPLPQLPIEVWENVINHLWDAQRTLRRCTINVCRAWYPPSRFHLRVQIKIKSVEDVKAYAKMLKQTPKWSGRAHDMTMIITNN